MLQHYQKKKDGAEKEIETVKQKVARITEQTVGSIKLQSLGTISFHSWCY
jgi:carbonic anhydrase